MTTSRLAGAAIAYLCAVNKDDQARRERRTEKHRDKTRLARYVAEQELRARLDDIQSVSARAKAPLGTNLAIRLLGTEGRAMLAAMAVACVRGGSCSPKSKHISPWHRPSAKRLVDAGLMVHSINGHVYLTNEGWALIPEACPELLHVLDESNPDYALDGAADDLDALNHRRQLFREADAWSDTHPIGTKVISERSWVKSGIVSGTSFVKFYNRGHHELLVEVAVEGRGTYQISTAALNRDCS